ncbi:GAF sensor signal transduction histidine kinase [Deinococcus irradiatisoli]|uniref:histidine kinase n=1 Tax=Deinococcus irradiatisoli TaxID=2202254 RepID=A0A2Z3JGK0_9DEIO|nr:GAF domain-containing protein [Deinococcus irradiatisoli]AWN24293.1 GAF sensor signal transduction histidine kinase [Deinococcus irradiatisoli]
MLTHQHVPFPDVQLLSQALAASVNSVVLVDVRQPDQPIVYANPAFERLSGYPASEILGHNCRFLQGPERDQPARFALQQAVEHGQSTTTILRNYRRDGSLFYNELTISPIHDAAGTVTHFVGFQNDVTERQQAAELMIHSQTLVQALAAVRTQESVFDLILRDGLEALGGIGGAVLLMHEGALRVAARHGPVEASVWQDGDLEGHRPSPDALRTNTPLFFSHHGELTAAYPELEACTGGVAPVASAVLPMVEDGRPLGTIVLDFREPHDFTPDEVHFLLTLAAQCALALDRAQLAENLEQQVENRTAELEAFVRFTELADGEMDMLALAQRAVEVLGVLFPGCSNGYYVLEDGRWKVKIYTEDLEAEPALLASLKAGLPLSTPIFAQPVQTGEPAFVDAWDAEKEQVAESESYQAVALYPLGVDGTVRAMFALGLKDTPHWTDHHKAVFRSVGRSLVLALERTQAARRLEEQNAELHAQTLVLEGVAELTRDLTLPGGPHQLIGQVMDLVLSLLPSGYASFWEVRDGLWRLITQRGDVGRPGWQAARERGFPVGHFPTLDRPWQTRQPYFQGHYDPVHDAVPDLMDHLLSIASLPVMVQGEMLGVFGVGLFGHRPWNVADQALLITAVQSLGLALERAEQARQLTDQRDMLKASNEELEAFTYSVSHDLRTPVRHIISFGNLLRRTMTAPLDEKTERYFKVIEEAALHLNRLIDGMLELSRASRQPLRLETVDLDRVVEAVRQEVMVGAQHQVTWQVSLLPQVTGDATLIRQVVTALLENAVKYSRTREEALIEVWAEERGQTWALFVRDNGVGFDPRYKDKLFSMFQRLHRQEEFEGAGVSLANARRIVARHGGLMTGEGQLNGGATFGFILPKSVP